jgi:flagellar secretion chaperone FliS
MAPMQRAMSAYGQAAETLAPARQIVLLYDGAIRRIKEARRAIESRLINERYIAVEKATAIVEALYACLDHERGGEIARNLDRLYTYVVFRLQRVNLTDDASICDEVVERLGELRAAWEQIADGGSAPAVLPGPASERPRLRAAAPSTAVTI